eukprot:scaffold111303_cov66-Phaeocystis_antarctica.AAC.3
MVALANDWREQSPSVQIGRAWLSARLVRGSWVGVWPESASGNDARFISRAARVSLPSHSCTALTTYAL